MTFLEMIKKTLEKAQRPLTADEIWNKGMEYGYAQQVNTTGKTPQRTIGAQLYVNIRDNLKSDFKIFSRRPTVFGLRSWEVSDSLPKAYVDPTIYKKRFNYKEKDLHPILAYFAYI